MIVQCGSVVSSVYLFMSYNHIVYSAKMNFWEYFDMLKMCLNFFCLFVCRDGLLYNFHRNSIIKWLDLYAEGVTYEGLEMLEMFTCFSYILDGKSEKNTHYKCKKKSVHDKLIKKIKLKKKHTVSCHKGTHYGKQMGRFPQI